MAEDLLEKGTAVAADNEYNASEIQVLEGLEAVRKRPGMYIGSTSSSGLHHLVYEIVDNAIDEALAGYCTEINVSIDEGDIITVTDNGRGIPVDIQAQTGKPALEVVFTILHAGGKFGGGGYKVSGGLHGVGASVVNALSEWLTVQVHKNGQIYEMKFARGHVTQPMTVVGTTDHTGTSVTFKPDPQMFEDTVYDYEILQKRMREQAFLNGGLRIILEDRRSGKEQRDDMCYEGGTTFADVQFTLENQSNATGSFYLMADETEAGVYYITGGTANAEDATRFSPDAQGKLLIYGLEEDTYELVEVKTASGYTLLKDPISIVITTDYTANQPCGSLTASGTVDGDAVNMESMGDSANALVPLTVLNTRGFDLPKTGGTGTLVTTVCGVLLVSGMIALALFTSKRKRSN